MQNVQNAAEIQQRVINLVELYRTKVGKESQAAKDLAEEYRNQYDNEIDIAYDLHQQGVEGHILNIDIPEETIDDIRANEQLLGYFYQKVAQKDADKEVINYFLAEKYKTSIFTDEEESFLANHFTEMVNYIISTPNNDLSAVEGNDRNDLYLLPDEVLRFIKERFAMPSGSKIYNPFTGFAQLPNLYKDCSFFCEESYLSYYRRWNEYCDKVRETEHIVENKVDENELYAWMKIALFANSLDATIIEDSSTPQNCDAVIAYIPYIPSDIPSNSHGRTGNEPSDNGMINKINQSYQNLGDGGKMVLILPTEYLWEKKVLASGGKTSYGLELGSLWKQMIDDNSLVEIIQLPSVMGKSFHNEEHSIIFAEKGCNGKGLSFIDARFASIKSEGTLFNQTLDLEQLHAVIEGEGTDAKTGLRKLIQVPFSQVDPTLLVPQVYVIEKPLESEKPVPLTKLSSLVTSCICDVKEDLPEDTPWIKSSDLSEGICGTLNISAIQTAGCPNNPDGWSYGNRKLSNFLMGKYAYPERDIRISHYRNCKYIDGRSDAILFKLSGNGIYVAVIEAPGKAVAISPDIHVLLPIANYDAISIAAILKNPIVYRQLMPFEKYGLYGPYGYLKNILVPTDKRIIHDERTRILLEQRILKEKENELADQKKEYINEVRMRKHDMRPHLRQLASSQRLMLHYINSIGNIDELKRNLKNQLEHSQGALGNLSAIVDHLSDEEQFGDPELLNIDNVLLDIEVNHDDGEGFVIEYECDNDSFLNSGIKIPNIAAQLEMAREQGVDMVNFIREKAKEKLPLFVNIAAIDFQRLVTNIVENARRHGFTDKVRDDYYIGIELSYNSERGMYQIDFTNNGNPLPDGMTKSRYGIRGEKAGLTAGTGSGGYIVKSIVNHYGGDYDIFCKDGITTVRILLPIATI